MARDAILIAGGYGVVGRRIASLLAADYPVVVAGPHLDRAEACATAIGHGTRGRQLDITDDASIDAALSDVRAVISCIDQPQRRLLWRTIARGLLYTDITPHLITLGRGQAFEEIDAAARHSGARLVLGTGIVPGISNVIVRALAREVGGRVGAVETSLLLSASDSAGPASFDYLLQELTMRFDMHVEGVDRQVDAFSEPEEVTFPAPFGCRPAYLFPFSDQVLYPRTLGAKTVVTRLAIDPTRAARLLAGVIRVGGLNLLKFEGLRHALAGRPRESSTETRPRFALRVDVRNGDRRASGTLVGSAQADAAALGAAATAHAMLNGEIEGPGAWMPEQMLNPEPFFTRLRERGLKIVLSGATSLVASSQK